MSKALVVGGNSGIGLTMVVDLLQKGYEHVYVLGKEAINIQDVPAQYQDVFLERVSSGEINLAEEDYRAFDEINDVDTLIITAGFGRVALFDDLREKEIENLIKVNTLSIIQVVKKYYDKISGEQPFYTLIMGSIAGHVASPLFSVYGASKMGLCAFIENVNVELAAQGKPNRILDVSPGSLKNTKFNGGKTDVEALLSTTGEMLQRMYDRETVYIPNYEEVFKRVIDDYHRDPMAYGIYSYGYKQKNGRVSSKPQICIGYLSGTFDLFHVGHLNLLKRAKKQCDYLIVGLHKDGSWKGKETFIPFEERKSILEACRYVDKVVESFPEDCDAYDAFGIHKLFVGSDYKGTERFNRYEEYFKDKAVEIVYFPYMTTTSSTQIREKIKNEK